jgi:phosphatidylserine synthase
MTPRISALAVHLFTAVGASLAMLALHEAFLQDWAGMALWLALAFVVDGIDGPLARHFHRLAVSLTVAVLWTAGIAYATDFARRSR